MSAADRAAGVDPRVSVVIPCHSDERWGSLVAAVDSVLAQDVRPAEIVVVVDHNEKLYALARAELAGVTVLRNAYDRGVSGNRNTGVRHTSTPLIVLLDDDAMAHPGWLSGLVAPFEDPGVVGTGGAIRPMWQAGRPGWFPEEFLWAVGGSEPDGPRPNRVVRNVWSANMAVRREVFLAVDGFRAGFGKVGDRARPEDTDLCLRMARYAGGSWVFVPGALVDHRVPAERASRRTFLRRCYQEGRGKIEMARLNTGEMLRDERDYVRRDLPRGLARELGAFLRGHGMVHAARAGALVAGLACALAGALAEMLSAPAPLSGGVPAEATP